MGFHEETEIIFVDDASTDDSVDVLDEMVHQYSHVKVVRQDKSGPATARNKGLTMSEERVCLVCRFERPCC